MPSALVSEAIAHYDQLLTSYSPTEWGPAYAERVRHHWPREAAVEAFALRPFLIDEASYQSARTAASRVTDAMKIAMERLATDPALRRAIGIPAYMEQLLEIDLARGKPSCIGRLDGIVSADGTLKFIEFNAEPQSAPFQYELERAFEQLPIAKAFADRYATRTVDLYAQLYETLESRARARGGRMPAVAVLEKTLWKNHRRASWYRALMYCSSRGCPVVYVDPEELDYRNGKLLAHGIEIDMVAFVSWELLINARAKLKKLFSAISDGAVEVYGGVSRSLLASYKTMFELLSSSAYAELFPPELATAIASHIPWTRALRERTTDRSGTTVELLPYVRDHRDELVIKPAGGGGGKDVTIGKLATAEVWAAAMERGAKQNWIVQELAIPERQPFPVLGPDGSVAHHELACELTPYVWDASRVEGALCRVVDGAVIFDFGTRPLGLSTGIETATWIIDRR